MKSKLPVDCADGCSHVHVIAQVAKQAAQQSRRREVVLAAPSIVNKTDWGIL